MPKRHLPNIPQTIQVIIEKLDTSGLGISTWHNKQIVVHGAFPGEEVIVRVDGQGQFRIHGTAIAIVRPSPHRVSPRCAIVEQCGGCTLQRLDPKVQREIKYRTILETLDFLDNPTDIVRPFAFISDSYQYRNKALWMTAAAKHPDHSLDMGLFRPWSHDLVPLSTCPVQDQPTEIVLRHLPPLLQSYKVAATWLRAIMVRSNGKESLVTFVTYPGPQPSYVEPLADSLFAIPTVVGVAQNQTNPQSNAIIGPELHVLRGVDRLLFEIGPTRFFAGPTSFVQTYLEGAAHLIEQVRALLPGPFTTLVDLYAGVGMFALAMTERAAHILAVEASPDGTKWARHNFLNDTSACKLDAIHNDVLSFTAGTQPANSVDAVILDPPRAGCGAEVASAICNRLRPSVVVYVSCNPNSFARDARVFLASGYRVTDVVPVDMFPHTPHVELVAKLTL